MSSRRRFVTMLGAVVLVPLAPVSARAGGRTRIQVTLDRNHVEVGEAVVYSVTVVTEDGDSVPEPVLPAALAKAFAVEGPFNVGTQMQTSIVGARVSSRMIGSWTYSLIPMRPGEYRLAAHLIDDDGTKVGSNEPVLVVAGKSKVEAPADWSARPSEPRGDVFLWSVVDKTRVYVGEQVTYSLEVYERVRFLNIQLRNLPSFEDFWSLELPEGRRRTELVGGIGYTVHPGLRRALFPQRAGMLEIGSASATVGLRRRVQGEPIAVEVLPLPARGQPAGFSPNNVGRFAIKAAVDRDRVKQGEPFTLTVTIEGVGNVKFVDPGPWPQIDGVRRYDPKVESEMDPAHEVDGVPLVSGRQHYQFLLIPDAPGAVRIPPHRLSFFDPESERYETVATDPLVVNVEHNGSASAVGSEVEEPKDAGDDLQLAELAPPIVADALPRHTPGERWLTPRQWAYGMAAVPAAAGIAFGIGALARRVAGDELARDRTRQRNRRRQEIARAREAVESGEGFHGCIAGLLHEVAVARAGPEGVGLPRPELLRLLARRQIDEEDLRTLGDLLDRCDAARFGAHAGAREDRAALLAQALRIIRSSSLGKGFV